MKNSTLYLCRWCRNPMRAWLQIPKDWRRPALSQAYACYWCEHCHHGELFPRPSTSDLMAAYDIENYYTHPGEDSAAKDLRPRSFLSRLRGAVAWRFDYGSPLSSKDISSTVAPGSSICEIGCGDGRFARELQEEGYQVVCVEPDDVAREAALGRGLTVYPGFAESLPRELERSSFDLVLMIHVVEHCLDPLKALQEAASLLRPGGSLLCECPNNRAKGLRFAGNAWHWLDVPRHLNFFSRKSLAAACEAAGLEVTHHKFAGYYRQFTDDWIGIENDIRSIFLPDRNRQEGWWQSVRPWGHLVATAFASGDRKYDSIRIHARRPRSGAPQAVLKRNR